MVRMTLAKPDGRNTILVEESATIKSILEEQQVNYASATVMLDGCVMDPAGLRRTLAENGITDSCTLSLCVKMANA